MATPDDRAVGGAEALRRAIAAQEAERARIAGELHDGAGQVLTALALHLRSLEGQLSPGDVPDRLAELRRAVNETASGLRRLATDLRPSGLREHGLATAIARQAQHVAETAGVSVDLALDGLPTDLGEERDMALFRVVQESLANVARHSGAGRASVVAGVVGGALRLVVEDDGRGFDPGRPAERLGLAGIRERVGVLGGRLRVESRPGAGTAVIVDLKVPRP